MQILQEYKINLSHLKKYIYIFLLLILTGLVSICQADEGMYPLSSIKNINLQKAGMKLTQEELYNPNGVSLIDAIVRLGGCTGSFVSADGLIITNHHCAFGSVAAISDTVNDYIKKGYLAKSKNQESPAQGLTVKITVGYIDVSNDVLEEANKMSDAASRLNMIKIRMEEIVEVEKAKNPNLTYEISEMFAGKTYVLFKYQIIKDVRIVYVPQRNIGEYGGEKDNWEWPRHSGDFAFVRAYVAPDGSPAAYNKNNVPFKPSRYLKVNPQGIQENDFVFILGYPGRTFRNQPSQFYQYHAKYQLPFITNIYDWKIAKMEELGKNNYDLAIKYSSQIKSLANTTKNYKGKLQGFNRVPLIQEKQKEEQDLQKYILSSPELSSNYGTLLNDIQKVYDVKFKNAELFMWLSQLFNSTGIVKSAHTINNFTQEMKITYQLKWYDVFNSTAKMLKKQVSESYGMFVPDFDKAFIAKMLMDAYKNKNLSQVFVALNIPQRNDYSDELMMAYFERYAQKLVDQSSLKNPHQIFAMLDNKPESVFKIKDDLTSFVKKLSKLYNEQELLRQKQDAELNLLLAQLVEVKMLKNNAAFIPDANATLRFTYGYVRGYWPNDGIYNKPFTTLTGLIEKADNTEYILPEQYRQYENGKEFEGLAHKGLNDIPVDFLYNLDTTGGNSGSPVMNDKGELVGVNFDRAYTATINDYAWNENYSRSVAVDIRYVLWVTKKVAGADFLLKEMGI